MYRLLNSIAGHIPEEKWNNFVKLNDGVDDEIINRQMIKRERQDVHPVLQKQFKYYDFQNLYNDR
jgi:hypothetical protein